MRLAAEHVIGRQTFHLLARRIDQPRLAEAEMRTPQPGHALKIAVAVFVDHVDALAPAQQQRAFLDMMGEVGEGVDDRAHVTRGQELSGSMLVAPTGARMADQVAGARPANSNFCNQ